MNRDKRITVRFSSKEYDSIKRKCNELGFSQTSLYIRKKVLADVDDLLFTYKKIIDIYNHLAQLEM